MSRHAVRVAAAGAVALLAGLLTAPSASADIRTFPDVSGHITGVRVSHGPRTLGITAYDAEMTLGMYYHFWVDTDSTNPGPEYKVEVYPNSDGIFFKKVGNFASRGITVRCRGLRAIADVFGEDYAKVIIPRSCIGEPSRVRVRWSPTTKRTTTDASTSWTGLRVRSGSTPGSTAETQLS